MSNRILIVEDDPGIALSLKYPLEKEKDGEFTVDVASDGERGLELANSLLPDLVILDLHLPGIDGMEVCRQLRSSKKTETIPVIMLTARVEEDDKIAGLESGADDYITKPFSVKEVLARVRAVLRRARTPLDQPQRLRAGPVELDEAARSVEVDSVSIMLTRKEFDLLAHLIRRRGRVLTREQLLEKVWSYEHPGNTRTVDVHIRHLRRKMGPNAADWIETMVGVGYRFRGED